MTATLQVGPAFLFCPADRPDRYEKAARQADVVVLDLEDAVGPDRKELARSALLGHPLEPERTVVRINAMSSPYFADDLECLGSTPYRTVMVPKVDSAAHVSPMSSYDVIVMCETAAGVVGLPGVMAQSHVVGMMFGAEDLITSLGGHASRDSSGAFLNVVAHARSQSLLAASAAGAFAVDAVWIDLRNDGGLSRESSDAATSGFAAKACIHPLQTSIVRESFRPSEQDQSWARTVLAAAHEAGGAVIIVNGVMIDEPLLKQARLIMARAAATSATDS